MSDARKIFLHGELGRRQFKEVLSSLLSGLIVSPKPMWLVTPWISEFEVLDNQSGNWDLVQPSWGLKVVSFSQLLIDCVESGCLLNLVTRNEPSNRSFLKKLDDAVSGKDNYKRGISDALHSKGFLASDWLLSGSMNFTFSGTTKNDEHVDFTTDARTISETKLEFEEKYGSLLS